MATINQLVRKPRIKLVVKSNAGAGSVPSEAWRNPCIHHHPEEASTLHCVKYAVYV